MLDWAENRSHNKSNNLDLRLKKQQGVSGRRGKGGEMEKRKKMTEQCSG